MKTKDYAWLEKQLASDILDEDGGSIAAGRPRLRAVKAAQPNLGAQVLLERPSVAPNEHVDSPPALDATIQRQVFAVFAGFANWTGLPNGRPLATTS